ncbi:hypothetical protein [Arenimonas sp. MALMAid1274]|uniref:hypothetical protein n=1 Tax=Arenimonas sp. MALMAid1274 TaxID=3411630 RepID=UPI003BA0E181
MVMRLPRPVFCSLQMVTDVIAQRQRGGNAAFFNGIAAEWRQRVQDYDTHGGSPQHVAAWPAIQPRRNTFLNLYLSPATDSVQAPVLQDMRRRHGLNYCPACGEPGKPNTLDHYLPKTIYPHFCITPLNLFPMCDACQELKDTKIGDAANPRFFLHPYFDVFVANQVLELVIAAPYDTPTFRLGTHPGLTGPQTALVTCHVRELHIEQRFTGYFTGQYVRLLRQARLLRDSNQDVRAVLTGFRDAIAPVEVNVWDHIFYSATVANADLMDYLADGPLPAFR